MYNEYIKALKNCQTFADMEQIKADYPAESRGSDMRIISDIHILNKRNFIKEGYREGCDIACEILREIVEAYIKYKRGGFMYQ